MATADSYIAPTDMARLFSVMRKAERGEPIRVSALGGSITGGATASTEGNRWLNQSANWFMSRFGADGASRLINGGIGSTESVYGALRVERAMLQYTPDIVFLDFSVNNSPADIDSYESTIRKLLAWKPSVAVVPIQFCNGIGQGQGESLITVCQKYGLGSVSYQRDILAYLAGGGLPTGFCDDGVHPNDAGHARATTDVWHFLDQVRLRYEARKIAFPPPTDNSMEKTAFIERADMPTAFSSGFTYDPGTIEYGATVASSFAEWRVDVNGSGKLWVAARVSSSTANGKIAVFVDDVAMFTIDTCDPAWPFDKIEVFEVASGLTPGPHRVRLITGAGSTGSNVDVFGLGWTV